MNNQQKNKENSYVFLENKVDRKCFFLYNILSQGCTSKGGVPDAEDISAEEAPSEKGAWLQKKDVRQKRP